MKKKYVVAVVAVLTLVGGCIAYPHRDAVIAFIMAPNWINMFSMTIFILGAGYAIIERNMIIGGVSVTAAVILPWAKTFFVMYWPWIEECWRYQMRH